MAIKRTESDFLPNTLQALMCGSTTPEKKPCCHYIGQTIGATISSPHCANIKICHAVQVKKELLGIKRIHSASCHDLSAIDVFQ